MLFVIKANLSTFRKQEVFNVYKEATVNEIQIKFH